MLKSQETGLMIDFRHPISYLLEQVSANTLPTPLHAMAHLGSRRIEGGYFPHVRGKSRISGFARRDAHNDASRLREEFAEIGSLLHLSRKLVFVNYPPNILRYGFHLALFQVAKGDDGVLKFRMSEDILR
jgi:hypothetical protein